MVACIPVKIVYPQVRECFCVRTCGYEIPTCNFFQRGMLAYLFGKLISRQMPIQIVECLFPCLSILKRIVYLVNCNQTKVHGMNNKLTYYLTVYVKVWCIHVAKAGKCSLYEEVWSKYHDTFQLFCISTSWSSWITISFMIIKSSQESDLFI